MRNQLVLAAIALALVSFVIWSWMDFVSGGSVYTLQFRGTSSAAVLLLVLLVVRNLRLKREGSASSSVIRNEFLLGFVRNLLGAASASQSKQLLAEIKEAKAAADISHQLLVQLANAVIASVPHDLRPEKKPSRMTLEELRAFVTTFGSLLKEMQKSEGSSTNGPSKLLAEEGPGSKASDEASTKLREVLEVLMSVMAQSSPKEELPAKLSFNGILSRLRKEAQRIAAVTVSSLEAKKELELALQKSQQEAAAQKANCQALTDRLAVSVSHAKKLADSAKETTKEIAALKEEAQKLRKQFEELQGLHSRLLAERDTLVSKVDQLPAIIGSSGERESLLGSQRQQIAALTLSYGELRRRANRRVRKFVQSLRSIKGQLSNVQAELVQAKQALGENSERLAASQRATKAAEDLCQVARGKVAELERDIANQPPFVRKLLEVRAALSDPDKMVEFVNTVASDEKRRREVFLGLLAIDGSAQRIAEIVNILAVRCEELDPENAKDLELLEMLSGWQDTLMSFGVEAVTELTLPFLELLYNSSRHPSSSKLNPNLAFVMFGLSLRSTEAWERFRQTNPSFLWVVDQLPSGVRLGLAETSKDPKELVQLALGASAIRKACRLLTKLVSEQESTLRNVYGLQGDLRRAKSRIVDPLGLRRMRWISLGVTKSESREILQKGINAVTELYHLSPTTWRIILEVLYPEDGKEALVSQAQLMDLLGYDPRVVLLLLDTRRETLARYGILQNLEPFLTVALVESGRKGDRGRLSALGAILEEFIFGEKTTNDIPDFVKAQRALLEILLNRSNAMAQAAKG